MIRGNYSLAKEVKKNEHKQKQKIQQRQKQAHKITSLQEANPILIYFSIQKLEKESNPDAKQQKRLAKLRDDWAFIRKNNLHKDELEPFLAKQDRIKAEKLEDETKLKGKNSIYFNPELNPLGKVPYQISKDSDSKKRMPNLAKPIKNPHKYTPDPIIAQLGITPPDGQAPKFYKSVQNIHTDRTVDTVTST